MAQCAGVERARTAQASRPTPPARQWRKRARAPQRAAAANSSRSPDDALPHGRAAPRARAATGHGEDGNVSRRPLTLDLTLNNAEALAALDAQLRQSGVPALLAATSSGVRVRLGAL
jgi:hypothetical protein